VFTQQGPSARGAGLMLETVRSVRSRPQLQVGPKPDQVGAYRASKQPLVGNAALIGWAILRQIRVGLTKDQVTATIDGRAIHLDLGSTSEPKGANRDGSGAPCGDCCNQRPERSMTGPAAMGASALGPPSTPYGATEWHTRGMRCWEPSV
jgi:hypothetical protein